MSEFDHQLWSTFFGGKIRDSYKRFHQMLVRMQGTSIYTNFKTKSSQERSGFGHIENFRTVEDLSADGKMMAVSVTLPDWLYSFVSDNRVLTLNRNYFQIRKPLDRRVYELVRKHCGAQPRWRVSVAVLHAKSGSKAVLPKFRSQLRELQVSGRLLDYRMAWNPVKDMMIFYSYGSKGSQAFHEDEGEISAGARSSIRKAERK